MIHSWFHIFSGLPRQQWQVGPAPFRRATGRGQRLWAHSVHHRHVLRGALCWDGGARCLGARVYRDRSYLPHLQQLGWVLHWLRLGEKKKLLQKLPDVGDDSLMFWSCEVWGCQIRLAFSGEQANFSRLPIDVCWCLLMFLRWFVQRIRCRRGTVSTAAINLYAKNSDEEQLNRKVSQIFFLCLPFLEKDVNCPSKSEFADACFFFV